MEMNEDDFEKFIEQRENERKKNRMITKEDLIFGKIP